MSMLTKALGVKATGGRSPIMKLDAFLRKGYEQDARSPGFHASQLYKLCPRELALMALAEQSGAKMTAVPIGVGLQWRFDVGHALHQWIQDRYLGPMRMLEGIWRCQACHHEVNGLMPDKPHCSINGHPVRWTFREVPVQDTKLGIVGRCDGIYIPKKGQRLVLDIKTVNPDYYHGLRGPGPDYIWQAVCYMHLLKLDEAIILYAAPTMVEGLDRLPFKEFYVDYDRRVWKQIVDKVMAARRIVDAIGQKKKFTVPERLEVCCAKTSRRANDCPVRTECFEV